MRGRLRTVDDRPPPASFARNATSPSHFTTTSSCHVAFRVANLRVAAGPLCVACRLPLLDIRSAFKHGESPADKFSLR